MNKTLKIVLFGVILWVIPFLATLLLYKDKEPIMDIFLFRSVMLVLTALVAVILLVKYFEDITADYVKEGVIIGVSLIVISIGLDLVILAPMAGMTTTTYFYQIGIKYLGIPMISIGMGHLLQR